MFVPTCVAGCCRIYSWMQTHVWRSSLAGHWRWAGCSVPVCPARLSWRASLEQGLESDAGAAPLITRIATQPVHTQTVIHKSRYLFTLLLFLPHSRHFILFFIFLTISILLSFIRILEQRRKANISLCFSKRLRQTLLYKLKVKNSLMLKIRSFTSSVGK